MAIKEAESSIEVTFVVSTGDVFFGTVGKGFEGIEGLKTNDIAYMEYFEYPDRAKVEFELINKLDRAAIQAGLPPRNTDEQEFFIRREQAIKNDLGYRALFVDSDRTGLPVQAFFLMQDNSLVIINYKPTGGEDKPDNFNCAREYLKHNKARLERAGEFDAIRQLADYLNAVN